MKHLEEIPQCFLPVTPPQSSFQPKTSNSIKQSIILENTEVPQEQLLLLLQTTFDSTMSKSCTDEGKTNLFKMDILTTGPTNHTCVIEVSKDH